MTAEVVPVCQDVGHDSACVDDDSNFQALKNAFGESANDANSSLKEMKQCGEKIPKKKEQNNHVPHHHHRRKPSKKKRKWKPYSKMTWEEKKAAEEREELRADRIRGEMFDRGRPVAPYNTTQFIMAEHDPYEADDLDYSDRTKSSDVNNDEVSSKSSTSGVYSGQLNAGDSPLNDDDLLEHNYTDSPHMAPEFISQDFCEAYERVQEESLSTMTRDDLVREHMALERTLSYLQSKLSEEKRINNSYSVKVQNIEEQLEVLVTENKKLVRDNLSLRYGEDHPKVREADMADTYVFQTSDYEYEAPNNEQESVAESRFAEERSMECLNNEGELPQEETRNGEGKTSAPQVAASSDANASKEKASKPECSSCDADHASSERESDDSSAARNVKKKRRSQRQRDRQNKHRSANSPLPLSDREDSGWDAKMVTGVSGGDGPEAKRSGNAEGSRRDNRSTNAKGDAATADNAGGASGKDEGLPDPMDTESYSWGERGGTTASMESLESG